MSKSIQPATLLSAILDSNNGEAMVQAIAGHYSFLAVVCCTLCSGSVTWTGIMKRSRTSRSDQRRDVSTLVADGTRTDVSVGRPDHGASYTARAIRSWPRSLG